MINTDRIVPITVVDLLTMYGTILALQGDEVTAVQATDPGVFALEDADAGVYLAAEPVQTFDLTLAETETVPTVDLFFIAAYDYAGFTIGGEAVTTEGAEVNPDGRTLYHATNGTSTDTITITQVGF